MPNVLQPKPSVGGAVPPPQHSRTRSAQCITLRRLPALRASEIAAVCFPNDPLTIVPLALGLGTLTQSAEEAILLAANIGGDSDSVASIAGAILGAMYPTTVDHDWYRVVEVVNDHNLVAIANDLAQLRH